MTAVDAPASSGDALSVRESARSRCRDAAVEVSDLMRLLPRRIQPDFEPSERDATLFAQPKVARDKLRRLENEFVQSAIDADRLTPAAHRAYDVAPLDDPVQRGRHAGG